MVEEEEEEEEEGLFKADVVNEEEEEEEEEGLFKTDAVNEEDPERDRATQEEEASRFIELYSLPGCQWQVCIHRIP